MTVRRPFRRWARKGIAWVVLTVLSCTAPAPPASVDRAVAPGYADQGVAWTADARQSFYWTDQGSRLIPLDWLRALPTPDGRSFLADGLARYGYLEPGGPAGLPVGFTAGAWKGRVYAGMTCAACHTRQIRVDGVPLRIDGAPALADMQSFLHDIQAGGRRVLEDGTAFNAFAAKVLAGRDGQGPRDALRAEVMAWFQPLDMFLTRALPAQPWGPGRLDAVGMIFDRLTGLDIGGGPDPTLPINIRPADAPARYPFLWNVTRQDKTDWAGFADNGTDVLGLARNLGEVFGVFAIFNPQPFFFRQGIDYRTVNSADFHGLSELERLVKRIGPPRYPWPIDPVLAARGQEVWSRDPARGGCIACHGEQPGKHRLLAGPTWGTPLVDAGTDSRQYQVLGWTAQTGVMEGASIPFLRNARLGKQDTAFNVLSTAVIGSILEHVDPLATGRSGAARGGLEAVLAGAFRSPAATKQAGFRYEARVLKGIWAAAPYLHNGSVPTLADLLEEPEQRPASFRIGPEYDLQRLGLAITQPPGPLLVTTGCEDRASGNSRCGHRYGTSLPAEDKRALLEFMRGL